MEATGIVRALGKSVDPTKLKIGDRVIVNEPKCFTNLMNVPAARVIPLPDTFSMEDGAAAMSVYNTAHYALMYLARITKGDKVLIHCAAGGVGHAAISICQSVGAEIYATTSKGKRDIVRALGVEKIYDSRSTSWYDDIMKETDGQGVDVVLNSLAGAHQTLGLQVMRPGGRFLEIGKVDIFNNNKMDLLPFCKNTSFYAIDMDRMAGENPELVIQIYKEVAESFAQNRYKALPLTAFPMNQLHEALELLKSGKHVGKVILTNYVKREDGSEAPVVVRVLPKSRPETDGTILVTGGTGGFGSKLVGDAFKEGARHFIIPTRSGETHAVTEALKFIREAGGTVAVIKADISKEEDCRRVIDIAKAASPPLKKIIHAAGVSVDTVLPKMDMDKFHQVSSCKAMAAYLLSDLTKETEVEEFVTVSSIAPLIGGMGMISYASANAFLDGLTRYRRSIGLHGATFNMG